MTYKVTIRKVRIVADPTGRNRCRQLIGEEGYLHQSDSRSTSLQIPLEGNVGCIQLCSGRIASPCPYEVIEQRTVEVQTWTEIRRPLRRKLLDQSGWRCWYCGVEVHEKSMHIEHQYPKALGGTDDESNLVASCPDCNKAKRSMTVTEFRHRALHKGILTPHGLFFGESPHGFVRLP